MLNPTVAKVRDRIAQIRDQGESIGEQDTKAILIEPVLAALGWDLGELDQVRREYRFRSQDNPVDYALLDFGRPCLLIEAKALSTALDHRKCAAQVLGYASVCGVGWCLVTNGDEYRLYNSHASVDVEEKLFRSARLSDPEQTEQCLEMLLLIAKDRIGEPELFALWKSQFVDRRVRMTLEQLLAGEDAGLARLVHKRSPELTLAEVRESLRRATFHVHFPEVTVAAERPSARTRRAEPVSEDSPHEPQVRLSVDLADLIAGGTIRPPLQLQRSYKGVLLEATIDPDGRVSCQGVRYESLSTAAGMARKSVVGAPEGRAYPQTNGWTFWRYLDSETGSLRQVDYLRQSYLDHDA